MLQIIHIAIYVQIIILKVFWNPRNSPPYTPNDCVMYDYCLGTTVTRCPQAYFTECMSKYRQFLQCKYEALDMVSIDEYLNCSASCYINLTIVKIDRQGNAHEDYKTGNLSALSEALDVKGEKKKVVLFKGDPGMGKTTLAINICKCWAEGSLLQTYNAVILLTLRDPEIQAAKTVADLLLIPGDEKRRMVLNEIVESCGDGICFILEGYDELPRLLQKSSIFTKLTDNFPKCTLVYTSRPDACDRLENVASQIIQIEGFDQESLEEYISNTFKKIDDGETLASKLKLQLKNNHVISRILHIPINVAIVCLIFFHFSTLPETLTELYTLLCLRLILRHITTRTANVAQVEKLCSLDDLPEDIAKQFSQLCLIAYKGIESCRIIYSSQDLQSFGVPIDKISGLGLLVAAPTTSIYGKEKSYNFLHRTIQEFCAAWYISKMSIQDQLEYIKTYWIYRDHIMELRFYAGITGLRCSEVLNFMLPSKLVSWWFTDHFNNTIPLLMYCVYEAHNDEVCQLVGDHLDGIVDLTSENTLSIHDTIIHSTAYFVIQYKGKLLQISTDWMRTAYEFEMLFEALQERMPQHNNSNDNLVLRFKNSRITDQSLSFIIKLLSIQYPITELYMPHMYLKDTTCNNKDSTPTYPDVQMLSKIFTTSNTLTVLDISGTSFNTEEVASLADLRNVLVCDIRMQRCNLQNTGADKIGEMLYHNKSITSIDLSHNDIEDSGVEKLVYHLISNNTLQHLNLRGNKIALVGAMQLRRLISTDHPILTSIELSGNPLGDEGVCVILLSSLTVTMDHIGLEGIDVEMPLTCYIIAAALHKVKSISLNLPDNEIINKSIAKATTLKNLEVFIDIHTTFYKPAYENTIIAVSHNKSIERFILSYHGWYHGWISGIPHILKHNKTLKELIIKTANFLEFIDVFVLLFVTQLADSLMVNNSIKVLSIYNISMEGKLPMELLEKLKHNHVLEELTINFFGVDDHQLLDNMEKTIKEINQARRTAGVTCQLKLFLIN